MARETYKTMIRLGLVLWLMLAVNGNILADEKQNAAFDEWLNTRRMKFSHLYESRLEKLGLATSDSIPLFISRLDSEEIRVRRAAIRGLRLVADKDSDEAIPALIRAAKDKDSEVRGSAVAGLGDLGSLAVSAIPVITEVLDNDDGNSWVAARALAHFGESAEPAVASLTAALEHKESITRASAAMALECIGPKARSAVPALRNAWSDEDLDTRLEAARAVWRIEQSMDAIPVLSSLLDSDYPMIVFKAIEAVGEIGHPAAMALPKLQELRKDENKFNAVAAAWAIWRIEETEDLVAKLRPGLKHRDPAVRLGTAWALGKIGPDARVAITEFKEAFNDPTEFGFNLIMVDRAYKRIMMDSAD